MTVVLYSTEVLYCCCVLFSTFSTFDFFDFRLFRLFDFLCLQYLARRSAVSSNFEFFNFQFSLFFSSHVFVRRTVPGYTRFKNGFFRFLLFLFGFLDFWISGFLDFWIPGFRILKTQFSNFQIFELSNFQNHEIMKFIAILQRPTTNNKQSAVQRSPQRSSSVISSHSLPLPTPHSKRITYPYSVFHRISPQSST